MADERDMDRARRDAPEDDVALAVTAAGGRAGLPAKALGAAGEALATLHPTLGARLVARAQDAGGNAAARRLARGLSRGR